MKIQAVRGMQDLLPRQKEIYRYIEDTLRDVLAAYGYREMDYRSSNLRIFSVVWLVKIRISLKKKCIPLMTGMATA